MKIRAATLAGGTQNQDAYIIGDHFAGVFDGASNHRSSSEAPHDAAWYSNALAACVAEFRPHAETIEAAVSSAIDKVVGQFEGPPDACPTSTVVLARWAENVVETYVLGDSSLIILGREPRTITDGRIALLGSDLRRQYRQALAAGHGFDSSHSSRLARLQEIQAEWRNVVGGYWIAGSDPTAASHAIKEDVLPSSVTEIILCTDGGLKPVEYNIIPDWTALKRSDLMELVRKAQVMEQEDPNGLRWPRSKRHDDKTLVHLQFNA